jgi:signal transduction histidine kinase
MPRLFSSLRFQLIAIVLLSVLPAIVLNLYSGFEERTRAALQARKSAKKLVELASAQQARVIGEARSLLFTLSQSPHGYLLDAPQCSTYFRELLTSHPHYLNIGIAGADGKVVCSALPLKDPAGSMREEFFKQALEGEGFAIGSSRFDASTGKASIDFALPVPNTKAGVKTVAFAAVDLAWLSDLAAFLDFPEGATLTVIDHEGTVLVRYPQAEGFVGKAFPDAGVIKASLDKGGEGTVEGQGLYGVRRLYVFTPLDASARSAILYTGVPTRIVYSGAGQTMKRNMIALGLVGVLALIEAFVLGHVVIMRRVNALIETASRLAGGDLSARTGIRTGSSELEQLGAAFDRMADSLEKKNTERDRMAADLEMRVVQRAEALSRANVELRESADKLKSFAASVVHDLKSPAIGAYGLTKLLWRQYGNALDEKGMHYCDQIMKASEHVVELAEKVNGYIAAKESPLHIESLDLRKLLSDLKEEFSLRLAARSIRWIEPQKEIAVRADRLSLLRMFRNLIDNALNYGGEQLSEIRIEYEESESCHIFSVSDNGQGMSKKDAEKVFQKFQRSKSSSGIE